MQCPGCKTEFDGPAEGTRQLRHGDVCFCFTCGTPSIIDCLPGAELRARVPETEEERYYCERSRVVLGDSFIGMASPDLFGVVRLLLTAVPQGLSDDDLRVEHQAMVRRVETVARDLSCSMNDIERLATLLNRISKHREITDQRLRDTCEMFEESPRRALAAVHVVAVGLEHSDDPHVVTGMNCKERN